MERLKTNAGENDGKPGRVTIEELDTISLSGITDNERTANDIRTRLKRLYRQTRRKRQ